MSESLMRKKERVMPLVAAQPGIWMAEQLSTAVNAWSVAHYVELNGCLDEALLVQAVLNGMAEVDTLRLRFSEEDGVPVQWVDTSACFTPPQFVDLRQHQAPTQAALALMQQDLEQDNRIASGRPLYHHIIFRLSEHSWFWYQRFHHLVVDGFSFTAITRRIAEIYTALCRQQQPAPTPFTAFSEVVDEYIRYHDSANWQRDAAFWQQQARQLPMPASLSLLPLSGQGTTTQLIRQTLTFDPPHFRQLLDNHAAQDNLTPADMALALVALWLGRLCGRDEYSAGFIFMRRLGSVAISAGGAVLNVLPVGVKIEAERTLPQLACALAQQLKKVRRHQRYDAEQIQRDMGQLNEPLFGPVLNLKMFDYRLDFNGITGITHQLASGPVRDLEIALYIDEQGNAALEILANASRYQADTLRKHLDRLPLLLAQFAAQPALRCGQVHLLHPQEIALLQQVNDTAVSLPQETLSSLIARQAASTPGAPALADEHVQLSYQQMRQQVQALAAELAAQGVQAGDVVAVALPRSVFLSLSLQAIIELGAAWLPLDTGYPDERLIMMLEDARPRLLITTQTARFAQVKGLNCFDYHALLPATATVSHASRPEHTAYVIYTSGSTGRPKGVMVGQRAIVNRLLWMQQHYQLTGDDVVLQKTPCSFDVSVWEFFWPLIVGAQLVMAPPEAHRDPQVLLQLFKRYNVTTTHFVPSMLAAFVAALQDDEAIAHCASLKRVYCSGEALPTELCHVWQNKTAVPLHNLYGPTEAAVDVSWYPAFGESLQQVTGASVPIGYPVWNTGLRILDGNMQPVPPGIAGDLYLTGIQLAQGYLARADLTASRFIADPQNAGERMYRTGDVARWLPDGAVEYLGRSDDQLKIRGQRIELGEIDQAMLALEGVAQAVTCACVLRKDSAGGGDQRQLVGYVVASHGQPLDALRLREILSERLPAHMVPVTLVQIAAFPLSANGKLDRKALPQPELASTAAGRPPQTELEITIAGAFARVLDCEIHSVNDDFFALGGHSLLAMRLAVDLRRRLARPVTVGQVMVASSVLALAEQLALQQSEEEACRAGMDAILPLRRGNGPTLFCFHPASGFAWQFSILQRYLHARWSLTGIQSPRPGGPLQQATSLDEMCDSHLRTLRQQQPHGPYYLLGYSLGGTLAHAIAARLEAAGEEVAFLGLLDTWPPETQYWAQQQQGLVLDEEVLQEINREREAFIGAQQELRQSLEADQSGELFTAIEGNYADAVRLLATAKSRRFNGEAVLFVAKRTLKPYQQAESAWADWMGKLQTSFVDCSHVDIISAAAFELIGPRLNDLLQQAEK